MPLLEGTDGVEKMSKSLNNYIGITKRRQKYSAKVMSVSDELMWALYELLTILAEEIAAMRGAAEKGRAEIRATQK